MQAGRNQAYGGRRGGMNCWFPKGLIHLVPERRKQRDSWLLPKQPTNLLCICNKEESSSIHMCLTKCLSSFHCSLFMTLWTQNHQSWKFQGRYGVESGLRCARWGRKGVWAAFFTIDKYSNHSTMKKCQSVGCYESQSSCLVGLGLSVSAPLQKTQGTSHAWEIPPSSWQPQNEGLAEAGDFVLYP